MNAEEYLKSRMDEHNIRHLVDQLDAIYCGELIAVMKQYASTKAEEEAKAFAVFVMQPYITDPLKPEDFEDRYDQFKKDK